MVNSASWSENIAHCQGYKTSCVMVTRHPVLWFFTLFGQKILLFILALFLTFFPPTMNFRLSKVGKMTLRHLAQPQEHDISVLICKCIENFHLSTEELVSLLWTYCDHEELKHAAEDEEKATNLTKQRRRLLKLYCATTNWPSRYQGRRHRKHEACSVGPHLEQMNVE